MIEKNSENIHDGFSKDMFGTDEVTVTVEYEGNQDEEEQANDPVQNDIDDEELLKGDEEEEEEELNEEEEKIMDNITYVLLDILRDRLSEKELRKIREQAANKKKKGKGRKRRKQRKHSHHCLCLFNDDLSNESHK